jgi:hypothetical protein
MLHNIWFTETENKVHNSSALICKGKKGKTVPVLNYVIKHYAMKVYKV